MTEIGTGGPQVNLLAVAKLGAPRGLGGFLKLQSYSGEYEHLIGIKKILAAFKVEPGTAQPSSAPPNVASPSSARRDGMKLLSVRAVQSGDWGASFAFEGYDTPETARVLTGMELFLPRDEACPLKEGEYYIHDLVGLSVFSGGAKVGKVVSVLEGGADPLLEILLSGKAERPLVPFRSTFVGKVDLEAKSLELLAGWLLE
jgi:16S rRNA processing protein RimM